MKKWIILLAIILMSIGSADALTKPCTQPGCDDHSGDFTFNDNLIVTGGLTSESLRNGGSYYPNSLYRDNGWDDLAVSPHANVTNPVLEAGDVDDIEYLGAVLLANALKVTMNTHAANGTAHAAADTVNFPVATPDATDIATLYTLTGALLTAFNVHEIDDDAGAGSYHKGIEGTDATLASTATPTTVALASDRLDDLKTKYNTHDADNTANVPHQGGNEQQETQAASASGGVSGVADPFLFYDNDDSSWYMFIEIIGGAQNQTAYATSPDGLTWTYGSVLPITNGNDESFPFVFEYEGIRYIMPDQTGNSIKIYEFTTFPTAVTLTETISTTMNLIDTVLFPFEGLWWLVGFETGVGINAYSSPIPIGGTWTAHAGNPLIADAAATRRPAGRWIARDNYVLAFFHDQVANAVAMHKITGMGTFAISGPLTNSPIIIKDALESWRSADMHHIDVWEGSDLTNGIAVVDALQGASTRSIGIYQVEKPDINLNVIKSSILNSSGGDNDTIIRGLTDDNLFCVEAGDDEVGVGTCTPSAKLHVDSNAVNMVRFSNDLGEGTIGVGIPTKTSINITTILSDTNGGSGWTDKLVEIENNTIQYTGFAVNAGAATTQITNRSNIFNSIATVTGTHEITALINNLSQLGLTGAPSKDVKITDYRAYWSNYNRTATGSNVLTGDNWYGGYFSDAADARFEPDNLFGIYIEDQTGGETGNYGIVLNGNDCIWMNGITGTALCSETVTMSAANINAMNTPVTVITKRAGAILEFVDAAIVYTDATDYAACDAAFVFEYETSATAVSETFIAHTILTANANAILFVDKAGITADVLANVNKDIMMHNPGTQCTTGTGTLDAKVTYKVQVTGF